MSSPGAASARTARGFDRLAPVYDTLADFAFAGRIHESQIALLPSLPPVRRALVLGGGTGRFLAAFLGHDRGATAVSIDASDGMTERTGARLAAQGLLSRVDLRVGGLEKLDPRERFDLVVTHCFLDLFEEGELSDVVASLDRTLEPGGHWLFSDFQAVGSGLPGPARAGVVAALYAFFRFTCDIAASRLPDFDRAFDRVGLKCLESRSFGLGLLTAQLLRKT